MTSRFNRMGARGRQSGAALIVVLMLLVVVTILGIASMRGTIMQERMASATLGRAMAFQAAEAGLRQAEVMVREQTLLPDENQVGCVAGLCEQPTGDGTTPLAWETEGFWDNDGRGYRNGTVVASNGINLRPRYVVEYYGQSKGNDPSGAGGAPLDMGQPPPDASSNQTIYRITSRAVAPNGSEVILQSIYAR
ncbi:MAG: PilX N-terminal domain-containing pilus assembly protein [Pseudoxanthomonas suwonensis]|nr:PilX N-terminal domain-containing pilus assembly protein [Pseudoxanthomonas suwonensis]